MKRVTPQELTAEIDRLRRAPDGELRSNYFFTPLRDAAPLLQASESSVVFLDPEHDFQRVYFLSRDLDDLGRLLATVAERPLVADYVTARCDHEPVEAAFSAAGYTPMAVYQRMTNRDHSQRRVSKARIVYAEPQEADVLFDQLCRDFDPRLDHIPDRDELRALVQARQAIVHRSGSEIDAYMIYRLRGRTGHPNYWFSRPGNHPAVAFKVYSDYFADMAARGIRASFLWVEVRKTAQIGVYERFGFECDGLMTYTYVKEAA